MKKMIKLPAIILGLMLILSGISQKAKAQQYDDNNSSGEISLETFYDELAPYGTWFQDADYGYVWRPDATMGNFRPYYTNGHWAMTEYGNTWVSGYDWGWAPFHYGRWVLNRDNTWIWIPDTVWGPAWVSWRTGGGYYGWAPLGPDYDGDDDYNTPDNWWVFVPQANIYSNYYPRYYNRGQNFYNNTTVLNFRFGGRSRGRDAYFTGPRADDIRRVTHRDVRVYHVSPSENPGRTNITNNNTINIYRPRGGAGGGNNRPNQGRGNNQGQPQGQPQGQNQGANGRNPGGRNPQQNQQQAQQQQQNQQQQRNNQQAQQQQQNQQQQRNNQQAQQQNQQRNAQQAQQQAAQQQRQQGQPQNAAQQQMRIGQQRQQQMQQQLQQRQQQQQAQQQQQQRNIQQAQQQAMQQRQQQQNQQNQQQAQQRQQQQQQQQQQQNQQRQQQQQQQQNQQRQQQQNQQRQQQQRQQPAQPQAQPQHN